MKSKQDAIDRRAASLATLKPKNDLNNLLRSAIPINRPSTSGTINRRRKKWSSVRAKGKVIKAAVRWFCFTLSEPQPQPKASTFNSSKAFHCRSFDTSLSEFVARIRASTRNEKKKWSNTHKSINLVSWSTARTNDECNCIKFNPGNFFRWFFLFLVAWMAHSMTTIIIINAPSRLWHAASEVCRTGKVYFFIFHARRHNIVALPMKSTRYAIPSGFRWKWVWIFFSLHIAS